MLSQSLPSPQFNSISGETGTKLSYTERQLNPLSIGRALLYFGLPALLVRLMLYQGMPLLLSIGLNEFEATVVALMLPLALLFALAIAFTAREIGVSNWSALARRWRLKRMNCQAWLWTIGGLAVTILGAGLLMSTTTLLINAFPAIAPPETFPTLLDPRIEFSPAIFESLIGAPLLGNWGIVALYATLFFFNIAGEELWWRGYILPRQELVHGRWTWLIHGLLWLGFHLPFYPWAIFSLLPGCLAMSYVAQRTQNAWPAIIIHSITNGIGLLGAIAMVAGLVG